MSEKLKEDKLKEDLVKTFNKEFPESPLEEMEQSETIDIKGWITTGNYALNWVISKSFFKGLPLGRVVLFSGDPSSGKCAHFDTKVKLLNQQEKSAKEYFDNIEPGYEGSSDDLAFDCIEFSVNGSVFKIPENCKILTTNRGYVLASELQETDNIFCAK